jgi:hypothetical protein
MSQLSERREGDISPVADRCWRDRADQNVAGDAAGIARRRGRHRHSERIETFLDPASPPLRANTSVPTRSGMRSVVVA